MFKFDLAKITNFIKTFMEKLKTYVENFKQSKNKASIVLVFIFVALVTYGLTVFVGSCASDSNLKRGFLEVSGRIEGREYRAGTKIAGRVDEMLVKEGQEVKAGERIAHIYSHQRIALLGQAEAQLKEAESNLRLAQIEHERYGRLFAEEAIPKMEYDRVVNNYTVATEAVVAAKKEVEKRKADLQDTVIVAPISGVVVTKIVRLGDVIAVGTPLVTLINMDELYLKIFLATDFSGKINLDDEAKVFPDALSHSEFPAYVDRIAQKAEFTPKNVETRSQRAKLVFEIKLNITDNRGHKLKPGMPCNGVIKIKRNASWKSYRRSR
ncbi:MAG: efflux RND transporter periplasmic adaptor subunit [Candidatus Omnitrophica bacterium]|nr:efflux RND transporter periplasmic adaptor subunit [Candidatus Omnitrophota bacterium]